MMPMYLFLLLDRQSDAHKVNKTRTICYIKIEKASDLVLYRRPIFKIGCLGH